MSDLRPKELRIIEHALSMGSGYVLNFSSRTFAEFFDQELGIDIYADGWAGRGDSKANRLRAFLLGADNRSAARALRALASYRSEPRTCLPDDPLLLIAERLESAGDLARTDVIVPFTADETLEELVQAIERDVQADRPQAALDRLHTYCMKKFAHVLSQRSPTTTPAATLNGRAGQYLDELRKEAKVHRPISFEIMSSTIKILELFNSVRNDHSFAHDSSLIGKAEARFIFDAIGNLLRFIRATEGQRFGR